MLFYTSQIFKNKHALKVRNKIQYNLISVAASLLCLKETKDRKPWSMVPRIRVLSSTGAAWHLDLQTTGLGQELGTKCTAKGKQKRIWSNWSQAWRQPGSRHCNSCTFCSRWKAWLWGLLGMLEERLGSKWLLGPSSLGHRLWRCCHPHGEQLPCTAGAWRPAVLTPASLLRTKGARAVWRQEWGLGGGRVPRLTAW